MDDKLSWKDHVDKMINKTSVTISVNKHLRRWVSQDIALQIVTSQYFGQAYYGAPMWLTLQLLSAQWKRLENQLD